MEYVHQWPSAVMAASKTTSSIAQLRYFMHVINVPALSSFDVNSFHFVALA